MRVCSCLIWFGALIFSSVVFSFGQTQKNHGLTWEQSRKSGDGTIIIYWYESKPFIFRNKANQLAGIEYELIEGFKTHLREAYKTDIKINWVEARDFGNTYNIIRDGQIPGTFGASAFSIIPERQAEVNFTPSYMSDICVLISSKSVPIAKTPQEFNEIFSQLTAITIRQTTYEKDLLKLQKDENVPFEVEYIPSHQNILETIARKENAFGFIDLAVYMMMFNNNPSVTVKRQNLFPISREGLGIIYPKKSDWNIPINSYFESENFKSNFERIISHYLDPELYFFVEALARQSDTPIELLTKEKEIQYKDLVNKTEQIEKEQQTRNILIGLIAIVFLSLLLIIALYRKRNEQKEQIEIQQKKIESKSEQLEKRNEHLIALNEEKNNLIKILAHDLRTPINHIQGLAQIVLLSNEHLAEDQKMMINQITDSSVRLCKMIANLLDVDAIENNRIKILIDNVQISSLLKKVIASFEKQAQKKSIILDFKTGNENLFINGDSLFLIEIFENLISNALKFSEAGKKVEVHITEDIAGKVLIKVKDEGPGLTPEDQDLLFRRFQKLSARPTGGEGSLGLGLSIVKKYVELMNGEVWCQSTPGKGACFIVSFQKI
jgi:signal transduction histidine kinase